MYKLSIALLLSIACMLSSCQPPDRDENSPAQNNFNSMNGSIFIPAADYLNLHPEEQQISEQFSKNVQDGARPFPPGTQNSPVRIAFVYPSNQVSDYWRRSVVAFQARMEEIGISYELKDFFPKEAA